MDGQENRQKGVNMIAQSTPRKKPAKPKKPRPNFPLFAAGNGQWAAKIRGKRYHFGVWCAPEAAEAEFDRVKDYLRRGDEPPPKPGTVVSDDTQDTLTLHQAANFFLQSRERLVASGELGARSLADYHRTCELVLKFLGKSTQLRHVTPQRLEKLRADLAKTRKAVALGNEVQRVRTFLSYPHKARLTDHVIRFGDSFRRPSQRALRKAKANRGDLSFTPEEIRTLVDAADIELRCMILLGLSTGMGNSDISALPKSAITHDFRWINFPREKTAVPRRLPVWPEVAELLPQVIQRRAAPKDVGDQDLVFLTQNGARWVRAQTPKRFQGSDQPSPKVTVIDGIAAAFRKLQVKLNMRRQRRGFYTLRHLTQTLGETSGDYGATAAILGHVPRSHDMAAVYRLNVADDRLLAVSGTIRKWLWPDSKQKKCYHNVGDRRPMSPIANHAWQ